MRSIRYGVAVAAMMIPLCGAFAQSGYSQSRWAPSQQPVAAPAPSGRVDAAGLEARIMQLEEQLRRMNGQIEELQHRIVSQQNNQQQYQTMLENKLVALEQKLASGGPAAAVPAAPAALPPAPTPTPGTEPAVVPAASAPAPVSGAPATAREHYNQAFQLLNQANFKDARVSLDSFVQKYPDDPLVGNAYYWLGETHYVERNYLGAADNFRKGYEVKPTGPKAPDNLLKLGMSMATLGKQTEACVVYGQLFVQFPNMPGSVKQKAQQEQQRLQCPKG